MDFVTGPSFSSFISFSFGLMNSCACRLIAWSAALGAYPGWGGGAGGRGTSDFPDCMICTRRTAISFINCGWQCLSCRCVISENLFLFIPSQRAHRQGMSPSAPMGQCSRIACFSTSLGVLNERMQPVHSQRNGLVGSIFTGGGDGHGWGGVSAGCGGAGLAAAGGGVVDT